MSASTEFAMSLPFLGYKQRNAALDTVFYDTKRLSLEERAKLTPLADREGSIIVVPPRNSDRKIRHYRSALRFMTKEGQPFAPSLSPASAHQRSALLHLPASLRTRSIPT